METCQAIVAEFSYGPMFCSKEYYKTINPHDDEEELEVCYDHFMVFHTCITKEHDGYCYD